VREVTAGRDQARYWLSLGLLLAAVVAQLPGVVQPASLYDEGLTLVGADRLLSGEIPYRDFWNTHTPGQITVVAGLFRLVGPSMMVARGFDIVVRAAIALALYLLARRACPPAIALLAWLAAVLTLASYGSFGGTIFTALALSLVSLIVLLDARDPVMKGQGRGWQRLLAAGMIAGISLLFRHDFGCITMLAATGTLVAAHFVPRHESPERGTRLRSFVLDVLTYASGASLVVLPALSLVLIAGAPWHRLLEIFVTFPLFVFPQVRSLPIPQLGGDLIGGALLLGALLATLATSLVNLRRYPTSARAAWTLTGLGLLALAALPLTLVRIDRIHQVPLHLPSLVLLPGLFCLLAARNRPSRPSPWLGPLALLPLLVLPAAGELRTLRDAADNWRRGTAHGISRAWGIPLSDDQTRTVTAIAGMVSPGQPLFVGCGRHDRVRYNDALFYFLADRRCATYYHNLLPGLVTTGRVQREMVGELERARVEAVVLYTGEDAIREPNEGSLSSGVTLLDDHIRERFELVSVNGSYEIWTRR
jgi:hypothetical protein